MLSTVGRKHSPCPAASTHLGWQERVGVELAQLGHQLVLGVDHVLHEAARQREPVGAPVHHDALGDAALAQPPHVGVTLVEQAVQALLLDKPGHGDEEEGLGVSPTLLGAAAARASPYPSCFSSFLKSLLFLFLQLGLPGVVSAVRLQEVLISVFGEEHHQLLVGPAVQIRKH